MTQEDLKAIDRAVAEHVMGWTFWDVGEDATADDEPDPPFVTFDYDRALVLQEPDVDEPRDWSPTTNIAHAWEVLPDEPYDIDATVPEDGIRFTFYPNFGPPVWAEADTVMLARCLAALAAVGKPWEGKP